MSASHQGFRIGRNGMVIGHDLAMAALSFVLAQLLRRGWENFLLFSGPYLLEGTLIFTAVCGGVFWYLGVHRGEWRYASLTDLVRITKAVSLAVLVFLPLMFLVTRLETFPRSALAINWFVLLALLGGSRFGYRLMRYGTLGGAFDRAGGRRIPVLLVGAGDEAEAFIREMARQPEASYRVVGLIDDDPRRAGGYIHGLRILGQTAGLAEIVAKLRKKGERPQRLVISNDDYRGERLSALLESAERLGMTVGRLPKLTDFRSHDGGIETRPIALEDLLGRPQTVLDRQAMRRLVHGKRVLVTGAGGTIGSELVRQIAAYRPAAIALFDLAEHNLYQIDLELAETFPELPREALLGDVRDRARLDQVFRRLRPELVFHAAALKHVPLAEVNPNEAALTNAIGTQYVADACLAAGVGAMVLISTDKAVNPTSVMGATKRIAEGYCAALSAAEAEKPGGTSFVTVRFGNVLGSTGSVVPLFQRQLAAGGPLTVTHPEVTRYFMTVREAVELVLQASALGLEEPNGHGNILVLDMGEPVKVADLARQMIRLAGLRPDADIAIAFTGLRPGEKLHEELFHASEPLRETDVPGIFRAAARPAELGLLSAAIARLAAAARERRTEETLAQIRAIVPEYRPAYRGAEPEPAVPKRAAP